MSTAGDVPSDPPGPGNTRRAAGARREASLRVLVYVGDAEIEGWSLNVSSGGLRAILTEHVVSVGDECDVGFSGHRRSARVAWVREQKDGQIVGFEFLGTPR